MEDMPRKLPLHVVREKSRHGRWKFYFRRFKGPRIRLPDDPRSDEFEAAYQDAMAGRKLTRAEVSNTPSTSLKWLIDRYKESGTWKGYSAATQKQQENFFLSVLEKNSATAYRDIDKRSMRASMEARSDRPALANNFLKAMRALFKWAVKNDHMEVDPTEGVERFRYKSDGFAPWTVDDFIKFGEKWPIGTKPRLAVELLLHSGLRRSDIVKAGRQHLKGNIFSMRTTKTGAVITAEFPDNLLDVIAQSETGELAFIVSELGTPFTKESFGNWFRDRCREAKVEKSAHGVRKLSATLSAEGGAPAHELMAQYGWTNIKQAEVYTKGADRKALGIKGSRRIADQLKRSS
jgi:integrase